MDQYSAKLKRNILACYISDVVLGTFFQLPIWIVYQAKFLSFNEIAFYAGLALLIEVVTQLPTGAFADLYGRRISLAFGNLSMAIALFLLALFPSPGVMIWYAIFWGLGYAFCMGTSKSILYEALEAEGHEKLFGKFLSKSVVCFQISAAVSIALGGYLYQIKDSLPYIVSGCVSLLGLATSFMFIEERSKSVFILKDFLTTNLLGFKEIFKNNYVTKLTLLFSLMLGIASVNQKFFVQPFMVELGMGDIARSWASMLIKVFIALLGAKMVSTEKLFSKKYFLVFLPILMIVTLLPAQFVALPYAYATFIGIAFVSGNVGMFFAPEVNRNINSKIRSTATSAQKMLASLIGTCIQWGSGPIITASSVGHFYLYLGVFTLLVIFPLSVAVVRDRNRVSS